MLELNYVHAYVYVVCALNSTKNTYQRLCKWDGKGGIRPPLKIPEPGNLPNFAPWKAKIWEFS